jgi:outer membrane protein OmpA-like peptidoglycan-associated protein
MRVVTLGVLFSLSCQEDVTPAKTAWNDALASFGHQHADLFKTVATIRSKMAALPEPSQADVESTHLAKTLDLSLVHLEGQLDAILGLLRARSAAVQEAIRAGRLTAAQDAVNTAKLAVGAAVDDAKRQQDAVENLYDELERRRSSGTPPGALKTPNRLALPVETTYEDLEFRLGTAELDLTKPSTKISLEAIMTLLKSCREIAIEVEAHTAKAGDPKRNRELSVKRAQAVSRYLVSVGKVGAAQIRKVVGFGSERPAVDEPLVGSPAEQAMEPAQLAAIRARNDRVHIRVVRECKKAKP